MNKYLCVCYLRNIEQKYFDANICRFDRTTILLTNGKDRVDGKGSTK